MWSLEIEVMAVTSGLSTLVLSRRPPRPVSTTTSSTFCSAKCLNAMAVSTSKAVGAGLILAAIGSIIFTSRAKSDCGIMCPSICMRSRMSTRCGLVYNPVLYPVAWSMAAIIAQVLPLPLVPATWIERNCSWGLPSFLSRVRMRSKSKFWLV